MLLTVAIAAGVAGLLGLAVLWWLVRAAGLRETFGEGRATVVASDTGAAPRVMLRDPELGLRGRPDYVVEHETPDGRVELVPLELKPSRRSRRLYESDEVQLGAYLLVMRAEHGARAASHGFVRYATDTFRVELSEALEGRVRAIVAGIRAGRRAAVVHRSHHVPARCASCPVRERCDERLA